MKKNELRKIYSARRMQLSQVEYDDLNSQLLKQFQQLDLQGIGCIHLYLPIHKRKEPDTFGIRDWLREYHPEIKRAFPKADFADFTIENYLDDEDLELVVNQFGIPEPIAGNTIPATEIDLMLIPLLAHDTRGYRVGYGQGFYDRLMAQCRTDTRFIGLSFFGPVDLIEDVDEYDMKMDECFMPNPNPQGPEGGEKEAGI